MLKGLGTWLGLEDPAHTKTLDDKDKLVVEQEEKVVEAQNEVNKQQAAGQDGEQTASQVNQENSDQRKGLGGEKHSYFPCNYVRCVWGITVFVHG